MKKNSNLFKGFKWGGSSGWFKDVIIEEYTTYKNGQYQVDFEVEDGDIVFDFGASIGPFVFQIKNQNPSKVICIEPSNTIISTLVDNCQTTKLFSTNNIEHIINNSPNLLLKMPKNKFKYITSSIFLNMITLGEINKQI